MKVTICPNNHETGQRAAREGADLIRQAILQRGHAFIILATGVSQIEMLETLVREEINWSRVTAFHLDEYIGLPINHKASFRKYLKERFNDKLPQQVAEFYYIDGEKNPQPECRRLNRVISAVTIDVAFVGIGENSHLAFNDPPADFITEAPYIVVKLDDDCRRQQFGEGWFANQEDVRKQAISMSIRQIMKSRSIICTVPDKRKAEAVWKTLEDPVNPIVPASILQTHDDCRFFLDTESASKLTRQYND